MPPTYPVAAEAPQVARPRMDLMISPADNNVRGLAIAKKPAPQLER